MTVAIYEELQPLLRLIDRNGLTVLRDRDPRWQTFRGALPVGEGRGAAAANVKSSLGQLGLTDLTGLTDLGDEILAMRGRGRQEAIKRLLGRRMLLDRHGWAFCHALEVAGGQGRSAIWEFYQAQYDPAAPDHLMNISHFNTLLTWLGVSDGAYSLNRGRFEALIGVQMHELRGLAELSPDARLCLRALLTLDRGRAHKGREIQRAAQLLTGRAPNVHYMNAHATALRDAGLIEYTHPTGTGPSTDPINRGRHGEWSVRAGAVVDQLTADFMQIYLAVDTDWDMARIVHTPFAQLRVEIDDPDRDRAARALEWFAAKLCWRLGLRKISVRWEREVPGIEIDVIADRMEPTYERFLVQCKRHADPIGPPIIAKELGTASVRKIEALIFVATGGYTPAARAFRRQAMVETGRNILLLDQEDVDAICADDGQLEAIVRRENAYCRAVRSEDATFWLPLQMQWLLPGVIAGRGLTAADGLDAWLGFRELDDRVDPGLRPMFLKSFGDRFAELERGEAFQLTFGL